MSARLGFDYELQLLKDNLAEMGHLIQNAIDKCMYAFKSQDETLAKEIIAGDRDINDIEKTIEARCLSLILKQQPVARDLRIVTTALKVVTDMERIGDQAADIAELILREKRDEIYNLTEHIPEMAKETKLMVGDAVEAFINVDIEKAQEIKLRDDVVDD
ncbi:MAG TPA: phosphate signaling complex protein PhoU, partial [Clostridiales bacterium]|nr:phosphate signaling complex protein PhoU [Clostridiales bacterium]